MNRHSFRTGFLSALIALATAGVVGAAAALMLPASLRPAEPDSERGAVTQGAVEPRAVVGMPVCAAIGQPFSYPAGPAITISCVHLPLLK